ncbi:CocE/NonD family hydrolase [Yinghuangia aomiensis]
MLTARLSGLTADARRKFASNTMRLCTDVLLEPHPAPAVPTVVVSGAEDTFTTPEHGHRLALVYPHAACLTIGEADHLLLLQRDVEFCERSSRISAADGGRAAVLRPVPPRTRGRPMSGACASTPGTPLDRGCGRVIFSPWSDPPYPRQPPRPACKGGVRRGVPGDRRRVRHRVPRAQRAPAIAMPDGTVISARVYAPHRAPGRPADRRCWSCRPRATSARTGTPSRAPRYAAAGYLVVAYAERGIGGSTGYLDFAGSRDIDDLSRSSTGRSTPRRPTRRGSASTAAPGASVGLQAAAVDPRIKAVAAFNRWTDFFRAFYTHDTEHELSAWFHVLAGRAVRAAPRPTWPPGTGSCLHGSGAAARQALLQDRANRSVNRRVAGLNAGRHRGVHGEQLVRHGRRRDPDRRVRSKR